MMILITFEDGTQEKVPPKFFESARRKKPMKGFDRIDEKCEEKYKLVNASDVKK